MAPSLQPGALARSVKNVSSTAPVMFGVEPNIIGTAGGLQYPDDNFSGSLYKVGVCDKGYERDYGGTVFGLDASLSSSLYGVSSAVQPASLRFLACIKS